MLGESLESLHPAPFRSISRAALPSAGERRRTAGSDPGAERAARGAPSASWLSSARGTGTPGSSPAIPATRACCTCTRSGCTSSRTASSSWTRPEASGWSARGSSPSGAHRSRRPSRRSGRSSHATTRRTCAAWRSTTCSSAEVLDGLGVVDGTGPAELTFERPGGARVQAKLTPLTASAYTAAFADPLHGHYPSVLPRAATAHVPRCAAGRCCGLGRWRAARPCTSASTPSSRRPPRRCARSSASCGARRSGG